MSTFPGIAPPRPIATRPTLYIGLAEHGHRHDIGYHAGDELAVLAILCRQVGAKRLSKFDAIRMAMQMGHEQWPRALHRMFHAGYVASVVADGLAAGRTRLLS